MVVSIVAYISASPSESKKKEPPPPPTLEELGVRASAEEAELVNTGWGGFWSTPGGAAGGGAGAGAGVGAPGVGGLGQGQGQALKRVGSEDEAS